MAQVESLGLHTPSALPYLIREGILPPEPKQELYQWETYILQDGDAAVEEETLATKDCVVWTRGKFIRNVYRFGLDGEDVAQAILTTFATTAEIALHTEPESQSNDLDGHRKNGSLPTQSVAATPAKARGFSASDSMSARGSSSRALVVFLKSKVHIYFLHGATHIVDLPFEIERAFPALQGCIVQRKPATPSTTLPAPQGVPAPSNSFLSSQRQISSSYLQSPTLVKSFASAQPTRPSPLSGNGRLNALYQDVLGSPDESDKTEVASLYSLTSPLSDFGVVTQSLHYHKPLLSSRAQPDAGVDFEALDIAEQLVYASAASESCHHDCGDMVPFMLIVTVNSDLQTLTVWHAWYIGEKPLHDLLKQRAALKAAKARRRSSFLSASMGNGATTPRTRHHEHIRESLVGGASLRHPGEPSVAPHTAPLSRKPTRQEEEAAMASQMDPDYQPAASQQPARESRRISSMNADMRASQSAINASFGTGARRNASFGGERKSFSHRKSRGSTPGSIFSRSLGPDDDFMDVDGSDDFGGEETVESVLRHIRASFEAAGADSVFGSAEEGYKREVIVRKLHTVAISSQRPHTALDLSSFSIVLLRDSLWARDGSQEKLNMYIHDKSAKNLQCLKLLVKNGTLWPHLASSPRASVPIVIGEGNASKCTDIAKLRSDNVEAVLVGSRGLVLSLDHDHICPLPPPAPYRVHHPLEVHSLQTHTDEDFGRNRTLPVHEVELALAHAGSHGSYDEVSEDRLCHRRKLILQPADGFSQRLLEVCQYLLPSAYASAVRITWCHAHAWLLQHPDSVSDTSSSLQDIALAATIFSSAVSLLDQKAKAALSVSRLAAGKQNLSGRASLQLHKRQRESRLLTKPAWSWTNHQHTSPRGLNERDREMSRKKDQLIPIATMLALEIASSLPSTSFADETTIENTMKLMRSLHVFREEQKLGGLPKVTGKMKQLSTVIAQLGDWLGLEAWGYSSGTYYNLEGADEDEFSFVKFRLQNAPRIGLYDEPVSVFQWFEHVMQHRSYEKYSSLRVIAAEGASVSMSNEFMARLDLLTPRITALSAMLEATRSLTTKPTSTVELLAKHKLSAVMLETLPDAIVAPFKEAVARCEREPPTSWHPALLQLIARDDLQLDTRSHLRLVPRNSSNNTNTRDVQAICHALDQHKHAAKTREAGRHAVSQLIFIEDRRLVEATALMHFNSVQTAECPKQPDWTDQYHLEQQRRVMQWIMIRMIALPLGDGMIHFDSQSPLMTEKFHLPGFNSTCLMQPMGHALTIDRSGLTEEKVNWAYFHAGASAGLRISRLVKGIDTSWIAFNKPNELTNRHAGLLLALGLGGHLRSLAKWLSFKYLTPKHSMTSVGLLLGLSASYIGSMDTLITRMLSVHITRMLPSGAAELNVSPITQTAGLMGIGLLYHNTQHRRMSEIMLSEIEYLEAEDPDSGPDQLRDESYRLAAGFALGLINLGKGRNLRGLHGMYLPERLLAVAVGPRPIHAVHVFDRATAGAVIAIALVYMKSGDVAIARKVDIPDTQAQYEHVRPDMLMLRAMAKHVILWDGIDLHKTNLGDSWIRSNLPACYKDRLLAITQSGGKYALKTSDVPFYNITTGLAWALSLKYAGSADVRARDEILAVLDCFYLIRGGGDVFYYDAKLARSTVRRCIDVLALSAATVMAGTGDLKTFRYLRRLHGRADPETTYGSHLAAHLAIGVLFLGGGTYTLSTSDLAIASLMCAFYPLYPTDVHDNRVHLQAFRHLWVFAAEARCLVIEDIDTQRPISMPLTVTMRDGSHRTMTAPCLLPDLATIATIYTDDPAYWRVTLDFANNTAHLTAFRQNQRIYVRRCPASEAYSSVFGATLAGLNDIRSSEVATQLWQSVFNLRALCMLDKEDVELILPSDTRSSIYTEDRGTVADGKLTLAKAVRSGNVDELWNLRMLFAWAERAREESDGRLRWLGNEFVEALRAKTDDRSRALGMAEQ